MSNDTLLSSPSPPLPRPERLHGGDKLRGGLYGLSNSLSSLFYLRYCMRRNAWRREKFLGRIITVIFWLAATIGVMCVFSVGSVLSYFIHSKLESDGQLYFWNIVILVFILAWLINLSNDLFRNDVLTLDRIMHLPISPSYAFLLNYLTSLIRLPLVYLVALASGAILGASLFYGPVALLLWISLIAYVFMVTALTSQFQGALTAWMATPRRRQLMMIILSVFFMFLFPAMAVLPQWLDDDSRSNINPPPVPEAGPEQPETPVGDPEPRGSSESQSRDTWDAGTEGAKVARLESWTNYLRWTQVCFPPFWFSACASGLGDSSFRAWWITPCMIGLGMISMRRSYQTTLRYYRDGFGTAVSTRAKSDRGGMDSGSDRIYWIERSLPGTSPIVSSIVMQTWISMWRAPEFKLMLLAPLVQPLVVAFLVQFWKIGQGEIPRTLALLAFAGLQCYTASGMLGNQFGLDRGGFRTWVLSPISRESILHGRNIAFGFPVWALAILLILGVGLWWGLAWDKMVFAVLAVSAFIPGYLLVSDLMSILSPFGIPTGTLQPKEFSWKQIVVSLALSTLHPTLLCLAALPFGVELLVEWLFPQTAAWPIAAAMALPWLGLSFALYRLLLPWVARCFEHFELYILKIVTAPID